VIDTLPYRDPSTAVRRGMDELARRRHVDFMARTWQRGQDPFLVGTHTRQICAALDRAIAMFREGLSTYLAIKVPVRHGKSDIVSRYFPAHFLGEFPNEEAIICTYGSSLSYTFSKFGLRVMASDEYRGLYPHVELRRGDRSVSAWGVDGYQGRVAFQGLGSGIVGKGGSLIVLDDFFRGRADAESQVIRDKAWDAFANDLMSRRAPVSIVIVMGTPWHKDDIFGRITDAQTRGEAGFPVFEDLTFPARADTYPSGVLFPERFPAEWYTSMESLLGSYGTASLLQCNPITRGGAMFKVDNIREIEPAQFPANMTWVRGWDLASSTKERTKSDPDYTVGVRLACTQERDAATGMVRLRVFIDDIIRGQWEAGERSAHIIGAAKREDCQIGVEAFGAYKDAYSVLRDTLMGARAVSRVNLPGDKIAKASMLEPVVEAGHLYVRKGAPWVRDLRAEMADFTSGKHDDIVDAICVAIEMTRRVSAAERIAI
jgi:predicted phage terminase large subunit-like protein